MYPTEQSWSALRRCLRGEADYSHPADSEVARCAAIGQVAGLLVAAQPAYAEMLHVACEEASFQSMVLGLAEDRVASWLKTAGISRWALLKGTASSRMLYEDPALRQRSDIDLLISADQMVPVARLLSTKGLVEKTAAQHWAASASTPYQRTWDMQVSSMVVEIDVHRRLLRWDELTIDHDGVLERANSLEGSSPPLCTREDLLLHTLIHAANEAFRVPLRSWVDVARLVRHPDLDWSAVVNRANTWRITPAIWSGLEVTQRWFQVAPPLGIVAALRPPHIQAACLKKLTSSDGQYPCPIETPVGRAVFRMLCRVTPRDAMRQARQAAAIRTALILTR